MGKKKNAQGQSTDVTKSAGAADQDTSEEKKIDDSQTTKVDTAVDAVKQAVAGKSADAEEVKGDTEKGPGFQRRNSRILLQKETEDGDEKKLYRPEFGKAETTGQQKIWEMMESYIGSDQKSIQRSIVNHVEYTLARTRFDFDDFGAYQAASLSVRDRLIEAWNDTQQYHTSKDVKRVYYFSLEFLMGRMMQNMLVNIDMEEQYKSALMDIGYDLENLYEAETDAALGNGRLGRLAACFLDSMATLELPAWGYGIRYDYGIFKQVIQDGRQVEIPDFWLRHGNPWEIERADIIYPVRFYGRVRKYHEGGVERAVWEDGQVVMAQAYDTPVPGYNTYNTNNLRLWRSRPCSEFNFDSFNKGDYFGAIQERQEAEYITSVLYPNDNSQAGKELRLKQQYFFCSASIRDIIRRYKKNHPNDWSQFADKNQIQLNDTHPAISVIELLRILMDEEKMPYDQAWSIVQNTYAYTNHTVLPEALEKWSVALIEHLLPRHMELIYLVNFFHIENLKKQFPGDGDKITRMSLIEEAAEKKVRMAYLSIVCAHTVNGVAALHTELLRQTIFSEWNAYYPGKLQNKTNGVTPRRWIHCCNPGLSALLSDTVGDVDEWITELDNLQSVANFATDPEFVKKFVEVKKENKKKLQAWVKKNTGIDIPLDSLYDIQVKRIHEYKRQLMNILYVVHRYLQIKDTPAGQRASKFVPRVIMIGGKAAPGYYSAKVIIELINRVGSVVNADRDIGDLLKVVFLPNYNVSSAQIIIPAAELSQHISTAGTEASGTSNMKFVMNGCLIIGTMDGANVEIAEEISKDNMFIFGMDVAGVAQARHEMYEQGRRDYVGSRLQRVYETIKSGNFGGNTQSFINLVDNLINGNDFYLVSQDFYSYVEAQERVDTTYRDQTLWNKMAIEGVAKSGKFSSDRTIAQYAKEIWKLDAVPIPQPSSDPKARVRSYANMPIDTKE